MDERQDEMNEDAEKTVRVASHLSSRVYEQASAREDRDSRRSEGGRPSGEVVRGTETGETGETVRRVELGGPLWPPAEVKAIHKAGKRPLKKTLIQVGCGIGILLVLSLLLLGVTGSVSNPHDAQAVVQSKAQLDQLISQARAVGVPAALLQPLLKQEKQLDASRSLPFDTHAQQSLVANYHSLSTRVPGIVALATVQAQARAQQDVQNFQTTLTRATVQGSGNIDSFSAQFSQDQSALATAKTPDDYQAIDQDARNGVLALAAREIALSQLADFNATIGRLKAAHIDVTAMEAQYQNDLQVFAQSTQVSDFQNLSTLLDAQYQQVVVSSVQAFPYVSVTKLNEMQTQIGQLKTYGVKTSSYQNRLNADQVAQEQARTVFDDLVFLKQVDADIASIQGVLVQGEARYLMKQYRQEVSAWAKVHPYYDRYDGHSYALDSGYMPQGIGAGIVSDLAATTTPSDFAAMVDEAQNALFNLHMFEANYSDSTPYNWVHKTDLEMLSHYKLQHRMVLMISLGEQAMRVYQNGKLLRSFSITTGRAELPSLPGVWAVLDRKSPIIFKATDPRGSPYWFPDTPIKYAILYHYGGYYVHDAWWRESFGPGTQFPHLDAGGNTSYNFDGSHGCVNLTESDAAWVYQHTDWNTQIVIY